MYKDYYRILQVHPEAEPDVIEAAYKRLMKKYHPDLLSEEYINNPDILQKAKDMNEAYEILKDPIARDAYDSIYEQGFNTQQAEEKSTEQSASVYDRAFLFIRCGTSGEEFKAFLVRKKETDHFFKLVGFEEVGSMEPTNKNLLASFLNKFKLTRRNNSLSDTYNFIDSEAMSDGQLKKVLHGNAHLGMGDIDWGDHRCPSCAGNIINPNGTLATWVGCSKCGRIRCAGGIKETKLGSFSNCPWCGQTNKITRSVKLGDKDKLEIHGLKESESNQGYKLDSSSKKYLGGGGED